MSHRQLSISRLILSLGEYIYISRVLCIDPIETPQPPASQAFTFHNLYTPGDIDFKRLSQIVTQYGHSSVAVPPSWKQATCTCDVSPMFWAGPAAGTVGEVCMEFMDESSCSVIVHVQSPTCEGAALTLSKSEQEDQAAPGPGKVSHLAHRDYLRLSKRFGCIGGEW